MWERRSARWQWILRLVTSIAFTPVMSYLLLTTLISLLLNYIKLYLLEKKKKSTYSLKGSWKYQLLGHVGNFPKPPRIGGIYFINEKAFSWSPGGDWLMRTVMNLYSHWPLSSLHVGDLCKAWRISGAALWSLDCQGLQVWLRRNDSIVSPVPRAHVLF